MCIALDWAHLITSDIILTESYGTDGGKNPVWNQTFKVNIINDNSVTIEVRDEDVGKDDLIGHCQISLAKARSYGSDKVQAPVMSKSGKQHGFVQVSLGFSKNSAIGAPQHGAYPQQPYPQHAPAPSGYPPQPYPAPYPAPAPAPYPPQQAYPAPYPQGGGVMEAGEMTLTLEFAQGLKDKDVFGRQVSVQDSWT